MINLKKCPFCGGDAEIFSTGDCWEETFYRIHCKKFCCVQVNFYSSEIAAAEAWNRRANEAQPVQPEIILCKDCKFFIDHRCYYWRTVENWMGTDDFCSNAERKIDEGLDIQR